MNLRPISLEKSMSAKYLSAPVAYTVTNDSFNMTKIWQLKVASSYYEADSAWGYGFKGTCSPGIYPSNSMYQIIVPYVWNHPSQDYTTICKNMF